MTYLTALIIQERPQDIVCTAGGPNKNGKWAGWINLHKPNGDYDHPLISTNAVYDSKRKAIKAMKDLVKEVMAMDLDKEADKS